MFATIRWICRRFRRIRPREQVARARALLVDELLVDFPFVKESDRAHAVAAILLPFLRRMIGGLAPIHLIEAPTKAPVKDCWPA